MIELKIMQDQVGHAYASTTAIYTGVSDEYRNRLVQRAMRLSCTREHCTVRTQVAPDLALFGLTLRVATGFRGVDGKECPV